MAGLLWGGGRAWPENGLLPGQGDFVKTLTLDITSILPFTHSPIYQLIHPRIHLSTHLFIYPQMFAEGLTAVRTLEMQWVSTRIQGI